MTAFSVGSSSSDNVISKKIQPPTTTHDDASPSDSCCDDLDRVIRLIQDERHLSAQSLLRTIYQRLSSKNDIQSSNSTSPARRLNLRHRFQKQQKEKSKDDHDKTRELLEENREILNKLEDRCRLFEKAKDNLTIDDDWTLAQTLFGITTFYRRETDGSLSIKLEGNLNGVPLFDQVAVLREVDMHYKWAPFCSSSLTISHLDKLDTVGWFCVGLPHFGLMRDGCFRAIGCDSIYEDGTVLLVAQGIQDRPEDGADNKHLDSKTETPESTPTASTKSSNSVKLDEEEQRHLFDFLSKDPILETLEIPPPPTRMGSGRMTIRTFQALINIESPTVATTKLVANIDPNLPLIPQSLIDFLMKRLCGVLLSKMQGAAKKISKDPVTNHHAIKMREERDFYQGWLLPKFQGICQLRGWTMHPISAFQLSEAQNDFANAIAKKRNRKSGKKPLQHAHTMSEDNLDKYLDACEVRSFAESEPVDVGRKNNNNRGPKIRTRTFDSDDFSDLSRNSSSAASFFTSNPISNYLREIEERTQARKDEEIKKSRQRAAKRLRPKELDEESRSRLEELRMARDRRLSTKSQYHRESSPKDTQVTAPQNSLYARDRRRDWALFWTKHGAFTKIFVMVLLTSSLFGILYSDAVVGHILSPVDHQSFWMSRKKDVIALAYVGVAGLIHFFLCYVALMYAFSSLQLGAIAGKQAKKFYSQNVHLIVALMSSGMIFLGIIQTGFYSLCRWLVWRGLSVVRIMEEKSLPFSHSLNAVSSSVKVVVHAIGSILSWVERLFLESNKVGRGMRSVTGVLYGSIASNAARWTSFVDRSVNEYEGAVPPTPWREEVFFNTRALLSYTAVFLMVLLLLFNILARNARGAETRQSDASEEDDSVISNGDKLLVSNSQNSKREYSASPVFDTIQEED